MAVTQLAMAGAAQVYGAILSSIGWQIGRKIEDNPANFFVNAILVGLLLFVFLGGLVLPIMAMRRLVRWYPNSQVWYVFRVLIPWLLAAAIGLALLAVPLLFVADHRVGKGASDAMRYQELVRLMLVAGPCVLGFGLIAGLIDRRKRKRAYGVALDNQAFLDKHGIRELDGGNATHVDGNGNRLRLDSTGRDLIEFRNVTAGEEAFIRIGPDGRFLSYSSSAV